MPEDQITQQNAENSTQNPHYYGGNVRNLFLGGAAVLMFTALIDKEFSEFYLTLGVFILLALVVLAGLTNPKTLRSIIADTVCSAVLFVFFEYSALIGNSMSTSSKLDPIFFLRQILAGIFLVALYFSIRTWRNMRSGNNSGSYGR